MLSDDNPTLHSGYQTTIDYHSIFRYIFKRMYITEKSPLKEMIIMMENPTVRKSIELAVETEKAGAEFYENLSKKFENEKEIHEVFKKLARDEKVHQEQFSMLLKTLADDEGEMEEIDRDALRATSNSQFFKTENMQAMKNVDSAEEALNRAYKFEKSSLLYYNTIRDAMKNESKELDSIIDAEKRHMTNIMKVILNDARFRGLQDDF